VNGTWGLDVALLVLRDPPWAEQVLTRPQFARVDRSRTGELVDCVVVGYPTYELTPNQDLTIAEVRGFIRQGEGQGAQSRYLILRDDKLGAVHAPPYVSSGQAAPDSPWGGLSGALVFYQGQVLGHVVQHRPHLGNNPLSVVPIDRIARATAPKARRIAKLLELPPEEALPWAGGAVTELAGLVDLLESDGDLPTVAELTPYQLGADPTQYGNRDSHGQQDPYLSRTANQVDDRLREALDTPASLVLLVGPSKAGKTRTAFEGIRSQWPNARLAKPAPGNLADLVDHPRIASTDWALVVWLDDLQRYLFGDRALTPARLQKLVTRPGPTIVLATLRQEERARLADHPDLTPGARQLLTDARPTTIDLAPTSADPTEQAAAQAAYPELDLDEFGLAEQLAGAPALLNTYNDAAPLLRAVLQTAIDWERVGMPRPIPESDLQDLARYQLKIIARYLNPTAAALATAIEDARTPPTDSDGRTTGQLAALEVHRPDDYTWSYTPYPYLVAHDNGQGGRPRPIPDGFWQVILGRAIPEEADAIGTAAYHRGNSDIAVQALTIAANAGNGQSMRNLGWLCANEMVPPDLVAAQTWYQKAADHGNASAMHAYGVLLANQLSPPDLETAQTWLEKAANLGHPGAMRSLGYLLANQRTPPDLAAAQTWYQKAANLGHPAAMRSLGYLLANQRTPPDLDGARTWYRTAADLGDTAAMRGLGYLLADRLIPPDLDGARTWYQKAADHGDTGAMVNLGDLLADRLIPPDLDGARTWYQKAAELGDTTGMRGCGYLLADKLIPPELDGARSWYQKAAELGNTDAMVDLGNLLADKANPPDLEGARTWYQKAADSNNSGGITGLGRMELSATKLGMPNV
jgi:TPR repeat protein